MRGQKQETKHGPVMSSNIIPEILLSWPNNNIHLIFHLNIFHLELQKC